MKEAIVKEIAMAGLKTIPIYVEDIVQGAPKMKDSLGRLDLLGQILMTGYEVKIHSHSETPASQSTVIHPFSVKVRGRVHCTELCLKILRNASSLPPRKQVEEANKLLEPYDIYLEEA